MICNYKMGTICARFNKGNIISFDKFNPSYFFEKPLVKEKTLQLKRLAV